MTKTYNLMNGLFFVAGCGALGFGMAMVLGLAGTFITVGIALIVSCSVDRICITVAQKG